MDLLSADLMPGCFPSEFPIRSNFKLQSNLRQYRVGLFLVVIKESFSEFNRIKMVGRVEGFTNIDNITKIQLGAEELPFINSLHFSLYFPMTVSKR